MNKRRFCSQWGFQLILMFFLLMSLYSQEPQIIFRAQPETIEIGDSVVLSWDVPGVSDAGAVFLTNIGRVERKGHLEVTPMKKTTTYTLLSQGASGVKVAHVTIEVKGGRSGRGDAFPKREDFQHGRSYEIAAPSHGHLLDDFHGVLQNSMGFEVDERYNRKEKRTVFVTKTYQLPDLVKKDESRIRFRRLAYWVEVLDSYSKAGKYTCEIRTFIQYQRRKERKWRPETSDDIHRESAEKLRQDIQKEI